MNNDCPDPGGSAVAHVDSALRELAPGYLERRRQDARTIMGSVEQREFETIRVLGHDMKGTGGGYGFDAITSIGSSLEQAARDQNSEEIRKLVPELAIYLESVEIVYV